MFPCEKAIKYYYYYNYFTRTEPASEVTILSYFLEGIVSYLSITQQGKILT